MIQHQRQQQQLPSLELHEWRLAEIESNMGKIQDELSNVVTAQAVTAKSVSMLVKFGWIVLTAVVGSLLAQLIMKVFA